MNHPYMTGVGANAMIGTDKIIFPVNHSATMNVNYDYVIMTYNKPFNFIVEEIDFHANYIKELWYDNYYFTYKYSFKKNDMVIRLYDNDKGVTKLIDSPNGVSCHDFQFGDHHTDKITLSNGDIMFNNFGDADSCLIFTRNSPKVEIYKKNPTFSDESIENENEMIEDIFIKELYYNRQHIDDILEKIECDTKIINTTKKYF